MTLRLVWLVPAVLALPACGELPSHGPLAGQILASGEKASAAEAAQAVDTRYAIVDLNETTLAALNRAPRPSLMQRFGDKAPAPTQQIGVGDVVSVSIWEAGTGLFAASGGVAPTGAEGAHSVTLPPQVVDQRGNISVPYAAKPIRAVGRTPTQVAEAIEQALASQASQPQVIVTVPESASATASVLGDQTGAARVPLNIKGDRLLDVVAQGGGIRSLPAETFITLTRAGASETVDLPTVLKDPSENIYIQPGDVIYVTRHPQTFTALGSVSSSGELPIDQEPFTLAQAVGRAGGLAPNAADASAVFIFRFESRAVFRQIRDNSPLLATRQPVPVVYRLSFEDPRGFFYAQQFPVRSRDLIYVGTASSVEFLKFLQVVRSAISVSTPATTVVSGGG
ncbi:polysaccharide export protein [Inquilinus limosus]|uniref:polysaccharide biosynthesis/export family protein n=1 Tax=Inquilinus limosus TaxID=171674 RepID=UPI0003FAA678|nr:polysaccharide biosynthesis/export family protein [Inquilinus limosus]